MKTHKNLVLMILFFLSCTGKKDFNPDSHLSPHQKDAVVSTIIRYVSKLPEQATHLDKFDSKYDSFYIKKASELRVEKFYPEKDIFYFLISQPAPSLIEKRHATGGKFKLSEKGDLIEYEEIFRTWKMVPDTLHTRSYLIFEKMVNGEALDSYYTKNSKNVEFIEFPDDNTFYDKSQRVWKNK